MLGSKMAQGSQSHGHVESYMEQYAAMGVDVTEDARQHSRQLVEQSMHGRMDEASSEACSLIAPAASRQPAPRVE